MKLPTTSRHIAMKSAVRPASMAVAASLLIAANTSPAAVVISSTAPGSNILSSNVGGIDSAIIDEDANANHARGNYFALGDAGGSNTGFQITAITLQKSNDQTYVNDTMTLRVFEGTNAQWVTGTGHSTVDDGSNYYVDTTVTPLHTEAFTLNSLITNNHFVTFELATPIIISEESDFGFFFTYDQGGGTQDRFRYRESQPGNPNGTRISITTTSHGGVGAREMEYYVQGTAVPEPGSVALLGLATIGLAARRRRG